MVYALFLLLLPQAGMASMAVLGTGLSDRLAVLHTRPHGLHQRPQTPADVARILPPSKKTMLPGVRTVADALRNKAKHPGGGLQAIQAPFFCGVDKHLLYALADEIQRVTCGSNLFFKCMFRDQK